MDRKFIHHEIRLTPWSVDLSNTLITDRCVHAGIDDYYWILKCAAVPRVPLAIGAPCMQPDVLLHAAGQSSVGACMVVSLLSLISGHVAAAALRVYNDVMGLLRAIEESPYVKRATNHLQTPT